MPKLRDIELGKIVTDESLLATPLLVICVDTFGTDFFEWEPRTFDIESRAAFGADIPDVNRDKIWALVTVLTTDGVYKSLETFLPIANTLNGAEADFSQYDPVTGEEAAWALTEIFLNDPPEEGLPFAARFSHEIRRYIGITLQTEGITEPNGLLRQVAEFDKVTTTIVEGITMGADEAMFQMYEQRQAEQKAEIDSYVSEMTRLLIHQLQQLPLQSGSTRNLDQLLRQVQMLGIDLGLPTPQEPQPSVLP